LGPPPPWTQRGGATLSCGCGVGGTQLGRLNKKPGTLWFSQTSNLPIFSLWLYPIHKSRDFGKKLLEKLVVKRIDYSAHSNRLFHEILKKIFSFF
jgi:hypothetical protein